MSPSPPRRALRPTALALALTTTLAGCGAGARALYDERPWLRPGATTADAILAARTAAADAPALTGLDALTAELLRSSPRLAAARERWRAAVDRVPQATRLPSFQAEYMWMPAPADAAMGSDEHRVELRQMVPFPSMLAGMDAEARAMARGAEAAYDAEVRDAVAALRVAYADLWYLQRALDVLDQNEDLARALSQIGAARLAEGQGLLFDVARAQAQLAQLTFDRVSLTERRDATVARLNAMVGRPATAPLLATELPERDVALDEARLLAQAVEHQQEIAMLDEEIRAADARLDVAGSRWAPDLMLGAALVRREPTGPDGSPEDMAGLMVGVAFPLSFHATAAGVSEADARLVAAIRAKQAHLDGLQAQLRDAVLAVRNAWRVRVLYDEELLPHAIAVLRNAEQERVTEPSMYADLLEARATWYSFALARDRAVADRFAAVARLEALVGAPLDAPPARQEVTP